MAKLNVQSYYIMFCKNELAVLFTCRVTSRNTAPVTYCLQKLNILFEVTVQVHLQHITLH